MPASRRSQRARRILVEAEEVTVAKDPHERAILVLVRRPTGAYTKQQSTFQAAGKVKTLPKNTGRITQPSVLIKTYDLTKATSRHHTSTT